jgi:hypothetical protein
MLSVLITTVLAYGESNGSPSTMSTMTMRYAVVDLSYNSCSILETSDMYLHCGTDLVIKCNFQALQICERQKIRLKNM